MNQNQDQNHVQSLPQNPLIPFSYHSHQVRTIKQPDKSVWFVAKDVCEVLGLANHKDTLKRLDDDEKSGVEISDPHGRHQLTSVISESGLYALIFRSNKPEAKTFRKWVTSEVLPAIRQNGAYDHQRTTGHQLRDRAHQSRDCKGAVLLPPATVPEAIAFGATCALQLMDRLTKTNRDLHFIHKMARYRNMGLTQRETATLMGISRDVLRSYESLAKACNLFIPQKIRRPKPEVCIIQNEGVRHE